MSEALWGVSRHSILRAAIVIAIPGYWSSHPSHRYTNSKDGWMVGRLGKPVPAAAPFERLMQWQSIAEANEWIRCHPLRQPEAQYQIDYCIDDERGTRFRSYAVTWADIECLAQQVLARNRGVEEVRRRLENAERVSGMLEPLLLKLGAGPRTSKQILRNWIVHVVSPDLALDSLLSEQHRKLLARAMELSKTNEFMKV